MCFFFIYIILLKTDRSNILPQVGALTPMEVFEICLLTFVTFYGRDYVLWGLTIPSEICSVSCWCWVVGEQLWYFKYISACNLLPVWFCSFQFQACRKIVKLTLRCLKTLRQNTLMLACSVYVPSWLAPIYISKLLVSWSLSSYLEQKSTTWMAKDNS